VKEEARVSYDIDDARYDAAMDAYEEELAPVLAGLVQPLMDAAEVAEEDQPHPWTYERALLQIWLDEGEDALQEHLEEELRDEAEEILRDNYEPGPCCYQFSCPCGNGNNYPG
jgi:hypothetical protein